MLNVEKKNEKNVHLDRTKKGKKKIIQYKLNKKLGMELSGKEFSANKVKMYLSVQQKGS